MQNQYNHEVFNNLRIKTSVLFILKQGVLRVPYLIILCILHALYKTDVIDNRGFPPDHFGCLFSFCKCSPEVFLMVSTCDYFPVGCPQGYFAQQALSLYPSFWYRF